MSAGVYALIGVVVGALATGTVQFALDARARSRAARVSARLLLNSLEQYDHVTSQEHQHVLAEVRSFAAWVDAANAFIEPVSGSSSRRLPSLGSR